MENNLGINTIKTPEKINVNVELATEKDWETYKKLRLLAIDSDTEGVFGPTKVQIDLAKTDDDWKRDLAPRDDMFVVLSRNGSEEIGMGIAGRVTDSDEMWYMGSSFTKKEYRRQGAGKKNLSKRLNEIIKRGGTIAVGGIKIGNEESMETLKSLGFEKYSEDKTWIYMQLDLTDQKTIQKINGILNS